MPDCFLSYFPLRSSHQSLLKVLARLHLHVSRDAVGIAATVDLVLRTAEQEIVQVLAMRKQNAGNTLLPASLCVR
jgi:hypothetical protein